MFVTGAIRLTANILVQYVCAIINVLETFVILKIRGTQLSRLK